MISFDVTTEQLQPFKKMSTNTEINVEELVQLSLQNENLKINKIHHTSSTSKGDGFTSNILFVTVTGTKNGTEKIYELAIKVGNTAIIENKIDNEPVVYKTIMSAFRKFQEDRIGRELFTSIPIYYNTFMYKNKIVTTLENLRKANYVLHNKQKALNLDHMKLILGEYGKLHAISFAFRDQQPEEFGKLVNGYPDIIRSFMKIPGSDFLTNIKTSFKSVLEETKNRNKLDVYEQGKKLEEKAIEIVTEVNDNNDEKAILHGDCWNNNFMFQYENTDEESPKKVKILDWQISNYASPVFDLSYHIYSCASPNELKSVPELLKAYYESFSNALQELGSDPNKLFPYTTLMEHWKKYSAFGVIFCSLILQFVLCNKDSIPDEYDIKDLGNISKNFKLDKELYFERTVGLLDHYVNYTLKL